MRTWGVAGELINPSTLLPINTRLASVAIEGHPQIRWVIASRRVLSLHQVPPVRIEDLARA